MREWLTVIIGLLILAVVLDGVRRVRRARRSSIKMPWSVQRGGGNDNQEAYGSELPNGGARVVNVRKPDDAQQLHRKLRETREQKTRQLGRNRIPQQVALNLDEQVPTLMEMELEEEKPTAGKRSRPANRDQFAESRPESAPETAEDLMSGEAVEDEDRIKPSFSALDEDPPAGAEVSPLGDVTEPSKPRNRQAAAPDKSHLDEMDEPAAKEEEEFREPEDVLVINVMAPKGERFRGDVLLETVLAQGMRFGSMNIFHHHAGANGEGGVFYSMANIVVPGTFDLATMKDEFTTPGVSLFLTLPVDADSGEAFEAMLSTAKAIAGNLGGELKDENRSVLTAQTIEHYRSRIKEFERKQLSRQS